MLTRLPEVHVRFSCCNTIEFRRYFSDKKAPASVNLILWATDKSVDGVSFAMHYHL
jgi:hypothetical protein